MSEIDKDAKELEKKVLDLAEAMDRAKTAQADRSDVVVEMKQAARARLELLAKDLQPVFASLPEGSDQFEFALTDGEQGRLWIDMTSFVRMGKDRRVYEFVKDTRLGRTILAHGEDRENIGKAVTNYVAARVLEREQAIEGDWIAMNGHSFDGSSQTETETPTPEPADGGVRAKSGMWFFVGIIGGAAIMVAWAWFGNAPAL